MQPILLVRIHITIYFLTCPIENYISFLPSTNISYAIEVIPKQRVIPTTQNEIEQNSIIPQWAIAVIVIGAGSLLFVVIFGAAVVS